MSRKTIFTAVAACVVLALSLVAIVLLTDLGRASDEPSADSGSDECPTTGTNYMMIASNDRFKGSDEQIAEGVNFFKRNCLIPIISQHSGTNMSGADYEKVLDIAEQQDMEIAIDWNKHLCISGSGSSATFTGSFETTDQSISEFFSQKIVNHPAFVGYYIFDEDDKQFGAAAQYGCTGPEYLATLEHFHDKVEGTEVRMFGITYPCLVLEGTTGCDTGVPFTTPTKTSLLPYEEDTFFKPFYESSYLDAVGYFQYPYTSSDPETNLNVRNYYSKDLYSVAIEETVRMAEANNKESFFLTQAYNNNGSSIITWEADQPGRWPTKQEYVEMVGEAEAAGVDWMAFWAEWANTPEEFEAKVDDIRNAIVSQDPAQ